MSFIDKYEQAKKKGTKGIPNFDMNRPYPPKNSLSDIGLELEVEPARGFILPGQGQLGAIAAKTTGAQWTVHQDGSLRNGGLEYVLSTPCREDELQGLLEGLYGVFKFTGAKLNLTNRCSTHVHVNVGGYKVNEMTAAIILWTMFEEQLVNFCGEQRKTNHFCLTAKDSPATLRSWEQFLQTGQVRFNDGIKYSALNIRPITTQGSLEYRCMRAEQSPELLILWAKFCLALTRYARKYKNPSLIANELSERSGLDMFMEICESSGIIDFGELVLRAEGNEDFSRMSIEGFRRCQNLCLGFPWSDWEPLIEAEHIPNPFEVKPKNRSQIEEIDLEAFMNAPVEEPRIRIHPQAIPVGMRIFSNAST